MISSGRLWGGDCQQSCNLSHPGDLYPRHQGQGGSLSIYQGSHPRQRRIQGRGHLGLTVHHQMQAGGFQFFLVTRISSADFNDVWGGGCEELREIDRQLRRCRVPSASDGHLLRVIDSSPQVFSNQSVGSRWDSFLPASAADIRDLLVSVVSCTSSPGSALPGDHFWRRQTNQGNQVGVAARGPFRMPFWHDA